MIFEKMHALFSDCKNPLEIKGLEVNNLVSYSVRMHSFPFSAYTYNEYKGKKVTLKYRLVTSRVGNLIYSEYNEKDFFKLLKEKAADKYYAYFVSTERDSMPDNKALANVFLSLEDALAREAKNPKLKNSPKSIWGLNKKGKFKQVAKCSKSVSKKYWKIRDG